jgi:hypothetical protein
MIAPLIADYIEACVDLYCTICNQSPRFDRWTPLTAQQRLKGFSASSGFFGIGVPRGESSELYRRSPRAVV